MTRPITQSDAPVRWSFANPSRRPAAVTSDEIASNAVRTIVLAKRGAR